MVNLRYRARQPTEEVYRLKSASSTNRAFCGVGHGLLCPRQLCSRQLCSRQCAPAVPPGVLASGHRRQVSQDIGDTSRRSIGDSGGGFDDRRCRKPSWSSPRSFVEHRVSGCRSLRGTGFTGLGLQAQARYEAEGEAALTPRSRRPKSSPSATSRRRRRVELVLRLRKQLAEAGLDAGADTISWHLARPHRTTLCRPRSTGS